jgi:hypothetical protein
MQWLLYIDLLVEDGSSRDMRYLIVFLILFFSIEAKAQQAQSWFSINMPFRKGNWEWHNDAGYRNELNKFTTQQFLFRTGVRHYFNEKMSSALGYAFFESKVQGTIANEFGPENRIWQEFNFQLKTKSNWSWIQRIRTEERWFSRTSLNESFFGFRARYRLALQRKLNEQLDIQFYNELMYQYQRLDWAFNQNRVGLNFFLKTGKSAQFNFGYTYMTTAQSPLHLLLLGYSKR